MHPAFSSPSSSSSSSSASHFFSPSPLFTSLHLPTPSPRFLKVACKIAVDDEKVERLARKAARRLERRGVRVDNRTLHQLRKKEEDKARRKAKKELKEGTVISGREMMWDAAFGKRLAEIIAGFKDQSLVVGKELKAQTLAVGEEQTLAVGEGFKDQMLALGGGLEYQTLAVGERFKDQTLTAGERSEDQNLAFAEGFEYQTLTLSEGFKDQTLAAGKGFNDRTRVSGERFGDQNLAVNERFIDQTLVVGKRFKGKNLAVGRGLKAQTSYGERNSDLINQAAQAHGQLDLDWRHGPVALDPEDSSKLPTVDRGSPSIRECRKVKISILSTEGARYQKVEREVSKRVENADKVVDVKAPILQGRDLDEFMKMVRSRRNGHLKFFLLDDETVEHRIFNGETVSADKEEILLSWLADQLNHADTRMKRFQFSMLMHRGRLKFTEGRVVKLVQKLGDLGNWRRAMHFVAWVHDRKRYQHSKSSDEDTSNLLKSCICILGFIRVLERCIVPMPST